MVPWRARSILREEEKYLEMNCIFENPAIVNVGIKIFDYITSNYLSRQHKIYQNQTSVSILDQFKNIKHKN